MASAFYQQVDIDRLLNNQAVTTEGNLSEGRLNIWRNSLPPQTGRLELLSDNVPLRTARLDGSAPDNVICLGQHIVLEPRRWDWLYVIGCGERRVRDDIVWKFIDGSVSYGEIAISDLWEGEAAYGEELALRSNVIHYPHHIQERMGITLWCQRIPISVRLPVVEMLLPENPAIHLFALTLVDHMSGIHAEGGS